MKQCTVRKIINFSDISLFCPEGDSNPRPFNYFIRKTAKIGRFRVQILERETFFMSGKLPIFPTVQRVSFLRFWNCFLDLQFPCCWPIWNWVEVQQNSLYYKKLYFVLPYIDLVHLSVRKIQSDFSVFWMIFTVKKFSFFHHCESHFFMNWDCHHELQTRIEYIWSFTGLRLHYVN